MLALPSGAFRNVQRYLRQKRATGRRVSPTEEKSAWSSYWDAMYGMRAEGTRLGLEKERIETGKEQFAESMALEKEKVADVGERFATTAAFAGEQAAATKERFGVTTAAAASRFATSTALAREQAAATASRFAATTALTREQMEKQERAAMISGGAQLAGTAVLGAHVLKGTAIGAKIGLGTAATTTASGASGIASGMGAGVPLAETTVLASGAESAGITAGGVAGTAALVYGGAKLLEATGGIREIPKEIAELGGFVADVIEAPFKFVADVVTGGK